MKRIVTILLALAALTLLLPAAAAEALPLMELHQINAGGCAAAYLLRDGSTVILVDCGLDIDNRANTPQKLMDYLEAVGITHVDAHIVTHYHADHAYNINRINEAWGDGGTVVYGPSEALPARYQPLKHGEYRQLKDGDALDIGAFRIDCVNPAEVKHDGEDNYDSLNFIVTYGTRRFMFTGDYCDYTMMQRHPDLITKIDVLCFPHHGLRPMCITKKSLKALRPDIVLVPGNTNWAVMDYFYWVDQHPRVYHCGQGHVIITTDGAGRLETAVTRTPPSAAK